MSSEPFICFIKDENTSILINKGHHSNFCKPSVLNDQSPAYLKDDTNGTIWTVTSQCDQFFDDLSNACLRYACTIMYIQGW